MKTVTIQLVDNGYSGMGVLNIRSLRSLVAKMPLNVIFDNR